MYQLRIAAVALVIAITFISGWKVNGWRWENKYQALVVAHEQELTKAKEESLSKERDLQAKMDAEVRNKDEKIRAINSQLVNTLSELSKRKARPDSMPVSPSPSVAENATGAQLYAEDAEFLAREAARADETVEALLSCYKAYDNARQQLNVTPVPH